MSRLIDADKLKKDILDLQDCYNGFSDTYDKACIIGVIDEQPTIERKKGKWIEEPNCYYRCSECGCHYPSIRGYMTYGFCPNCGADMREGEADEQIR